MPKRNIILVIINLLTLFVAFAASAAQKAPSNVCASDFRERFINIYPEIIDRWFKSATGQWILPAWFEGRFLTATVEETTKSDPNITASVMVNARDANTQSLGAALLMIGNNELTGMIIHGRASTSRLIGPVDNISAMKRTVASRHY